MAIFALLSWPVLALFLFSRLPALTAIIWVVLLPYLYLPEAFSIDLPGLPDIDKTTVISVGLMISLFFFQPKLYQAFRATTVQVAAPRFKLLLWLCVAVLFVGLFLMVFNNREPLVFELLFIPAARPWDVLSNVIEWVLTLLPFWVAMRYLSSPEAHHRLLVGFAVAALWYSALLLVEIRLSPQLHNWVYGYYQHSFAQHIRGGYRPMVFMQHGLWVGFFVFMGLVSAVGLWRVTQDKKWLWASVWIFIILFLSRNLAAFGLGLMVLGIVFMFGQRLQRWFVLLVALCVLFFPVLRQGQYVPTDQLVRMAEAVSANRAQSLEFRLRNEDALLERAWEKKWTGWAGWGRERVYNDVGRVLTIPDGLWIITIGQRGWIGYLSLFGLLTLPLMWLAMSRRIDHIPPQTMTLSLIAVGNLIYMILNATMTPIGLLVFGAVAGFVAYGAQTTETEEQPKGEIPRAHRRSKYTRFGAPEKNTGLQSRRPRRA